MNQHLKELIALKQNFKLHDGDKASVSALYQFADKLSGIEERREGSLGGCLPSAWHDGECI